MFTVPELTTHCSGDALRMPSNEAEKSSSMSGERRVRQEVLSLYRAPLTRRHGCSAVLVGSLCNSSTRREPTSVVAGKVTRVEVRPWSLWTWVQVTGGEENAGHQSERRTSGRHQTTSVTRPASGSMLHLVASVKSDD